MDKRGIGVSLSLLIGVILALAGAMLVAMVGSNLYNLLFPPIDLGVTTENSIEELRNLFFRWDSEGDRFEHTIIPLDVAEDEAIVFFGRDDDETIAWDGVLGVPLITTPNFEVIKKPTFKECAGYSCVCIYKTYQLLNTCTLPQISKGSLTKCWELEGIDQVVTPGLYGSDWGGTIMLKVLYKEDVDGGWNTEIGSKSYGAKKYENSEYSGIFNEAQVFNLLKTYQGVLPRDNKITFVSPIFLGCKEDSTHLSLYVERAELGDEGVIAYVSPNFDPTIPFRKQAIENYLSKQSGTT